MPEEIESGFSEYRKGNYAAAFQKFQSAANQGDREAQYRIGLLYANGEGVPQDHREAARWYQLAAQGGHSLAQYNLGLFYANGQGVSCDLTKAVGWYRSAAEQGDARAQYALGLSYMEGHGVSKNEEEAIRWWRLAAKQGDKLAQHSLGLVMKHAESKNMHKFHPPGILRRHWFLISQSLFFVGAAFVFSGLFSFPVPFGFSEGLVVMALMMHLFSEKVLGVSLSSGDKAFDYFFIYIMFSFVFGEWVVRGVLPLKWSLWISLVVSIGFTALVVYQIRFFRAQAGGKQEALRISLWGLVAVACFLFVLFSIWARLAPGT